MRLVHTKFAAWRCGGRAHGAGGRAESEGRKAALWARVRCQLQKGPARPCWPGFWGGRAEKRRRRRSSTSTSTSASSSSRPARCPARCPAHCPEPRARWPAPAGSMVGALMVDGYGDGLVIECGGEETDFLRTTGFGLLQVGWVVGWWGPPRGRYPLP